MKKRAQSEKESPKWRRESEGKKRAQSEEESPMWRELNMMNYEAKWKDRQRQKPNQKKTMKKSAGH